MSLIGRRIGNYEIKAKIGEGGMGSVYLGEHPLIGKRVAIKVLLDELVAKEDVVARFFNEAKAVNDIGHLNIVDIVDFGKTPGDNGQEIVYFIMEFLDGEALSSRIRRAGLPFKDTLHIVGQCCSALAASHAKGIVHRDLKPENIFLVTRGGDKNFAKILDFGIAKLTGDGGTSSHKTRTGLVIGTPTYMSPEQCEGKGHIDHRSDVYSLGIVMYELLTGSVPFPGEGFGEVLVAHLTQQPAKPSAVNPHVPPALEAIVMHAIEKDRNRRFQTMNEFLQAIEDPDAHAAAWRGLPDYAKSAAAATLPSMPAIQDGAPASAGGSPRPTTLEGAAAEVTLSPTRPRRARSRAPLVAAIAGVLALAGVGGYLGMSGKGDDKTPAVAAPATPPPAEPKHVAPVDDAVTVTVASDPPGAKVFRADKSEAEKQPTPIVFKLKKGDPPFDVQLRLDGYLPQMRTITSDESVKLLVSLAKIPPIPVVAKPEPPKVSNVGKPAKPSSPKPPKAPKPGKPKTTAPNDDMTIIEPNF
jgi:eukaryotic-like serine/threonine-protein kinase